LKSSSHKKASGIFIPLHAENRMRNEGNVETAREIFLKKKPGNLNFLLKQRYEWMNAFISNGHKGIEFGSGTGISKFFIKSEEFETSDMTGHEWLDHKYINALQPPFCDNSYDFIISENLIHHLAFPLEFFRQSDRILKPGGLLIIQETNASYMMRLLLRMMKHEGYNLNADVFDERSPQTDEKDLWSANNAISNLLFNDREKFSANIAGFEIIHDRYAEFAVLLNSGGIIAKTFYIPLPVFMLHLLNGADKLLIKIAPQIFALQRRIVLRKKTG
jgi:SAM-dependent methyltransferase